ncbi:LacI family DNA-binding transcriptional regulator [Paenibacillus sp. SI8]|uniref:LacI family DNA-binding transcriptional regulator n=1 Tax=unclassified Paenibacillus TaxID=185978 RepID=UPI003465C763
MDSTIKDVARLANVSIATVSRVLNNRSGYSEETRERVLQVIDQLGYQPNAIARGLINKRTQTVGVIFPYVSSMLSAEILNGIEETVHSFGSTVIVCKTDGIEERTMDYLQVLAEKRVDGVIFVSQFFEEQYDKLLSDVNIPVVLVSSIYYRSNLPYVKVDDKHAAYTATDYLIGKGHKKIAMLSGPKVDPITGVPRIEGFMEAMRFKGLPIDESLVFCAKKFSFEDGLLAAEQLLAGGPDITAVFASSDELAAALISTAYKLGIRVPEELSVIGYDNIKLAGMTIPPLTTVSQPLFEMGAMAAKMLFSILNSEGKVESRIMPHEVVERASVRNL